MTTPVFPLSPVSFLIYPEESRAFNKVQNTTDTGVVEMRPTSTRSLKKIKGTIQESSYNIGLILDFIENDLQQGSKPFFINIDGVYYTARLLDTTTTYSAILAGKHYELPMELWIGGEVYPTLTYTVVGANSSVSLDKYWELQIDSSVVSSGTSAISVSLEIPTIPATCILHSANISKAVLLNSILNTASLTITVPYVTFTIKDYYGTDLGYTFYEGGSSVVSAYMDAGEHTYSVHEYSMPNKTVTIAEGDNTTVSWIVPQGSIKWKDSYNNAVVTNLYINGVDTTDNVSPFNAKINYHAVLSLPEYNLTYSTNAEENTLTDYTFIIPAYQITALSAKDTGIYPVGLLIYEDSSNILTISSTVRTVTQPRANGNSYVYYLYADTDNGNKLIDSYSYSYSTINTTNTHTFTAPVLHLNYVSVDAFEFSDATSYQFADGAVLVSRDFAMSASDVTYNISIDGSTWYEQSTPSSFTNSDFYVKAGSVSVTFKGNNYDTAVAVGEYKSITVS